MSRSIYAASGCTRIVALAAALVALPCGASAEPTRKPTHGPTSRPTHGPTSRPAHKSQESPPTSGIYPAVNLSMTFGSTWGDSEYATPLDGQFAFSLRAELAMSFRRSSWGVGLYGELAEPGSHFESRWLGGGGLHIISPRLWIFGASLSSGFYGREFDAGSYAGFTSGLSLGLRPRLCFWDFLLAFRVDLRRAFGRDEQSVTLSAQVDVAALLALGAMAMKGPIF